MCLRGGTLVNEVKTRQMVEYATYTMAMQLGPNEAPLGRGYSRKLENGIKECEQVGKVGRETAVSPCWSVGVLRDREQRRERGLEVFVDFTNNRFSTFVFVASSS